MQKVIAEYGSLEQAQRAIHELELRTSIQNLMIAEKHRQKRRTFRAALRNEPKREEVAFQLVVNDEPRAVERMRALLRAPSA